MRRLRTLSQEYPEWTDAAILILGFALGANLFIFFKLSGLSQSYMESLLLAYRFHWSVPTISGIVIGTGFALLEYNVFPRLHIRYLPVLVVLRIVSFTLVILLSVIIVQVIVGSLILGYSLESTWEQILRFITTDLFLSLYIYLMLLGGVLNFFRAIGSRFGPGVLINYISGKYRRPVEEERAFLFIDLNNSTTLAEEMGHAQYSEMLKTLFSILSRLTPQYGGAIYQYVGDEAVITWVHNDGFSYARPVRLFEQFVRAIREEETHYLKKYGRVPGFKAALNCGKVIVTEMGHRRKELAYHGDVLNTASRLLGRCSDLDKEMLISELYKEGLEKENGFRISFVETMQLRGKKSSTNIYEVAIG